MRHDSGDYVGDGTTKWAYSRPQFDFMQRPSGNDRGDVVTIADLVEDDTLEEAGFDDDDHPERKPRTVASRHDPDATYLGRKPPKHVFGYMLHLVVRVAHDMPLLIETGRLTAVTADPARSLLPVIAQLAHDRANDPTLKAGIAAGTARKLGDIGTDCGYSQANPRNWHLPIRALGGNPIYRLHSQNQAGIHNRHPKVPFCDGEPVCECCIGHDLTKIRYPRPGAGDDLHLQFQRDVEQRFKLFGYRSNGDVRADGSRHLLAPHYDSDRPGGPGGCEFCVDAAGNTIIDPTTKQPKPRCCTKRSYVFTAEHLAWAQYPRYGTPAWRDRNVLRNRVEGANSLVKNTDIVRWGKQDSHHYRGRAFESIIAALAIAIVNLEQLENWEIVELDTNPNRGGRPRNPGLEQYLPATPTIATHAHSPP
jgi:hypothetical protein